MTRPVNSRALSVMLLFFCTPLAWGAKPYKIYVINRYGAYDIVCDTYTVKQNDHIWDILRRKGSIAEEDFPKFVKMLQDMNPSIQDVNKIYPRQKILIPLKEMPARESRPDAGSRYVTIPMIPDVLYKSHEVNAGECLSKIITAHLEVRWNQLASDYLETFKRLNPRISDLDLIYPGQTVRIPELPTSEPPDTEATFVAAREDERIQDADPEEVRTEAAPEETVTALNEPLQELESLGVSDKETQDALGADVSTRTGKSKSGTVTASHGLEGGNDRTAGPAKVLFKDGVDIITSDQSAGVPGWQRIVSMVATQIGGKLLSSGHCYFPGKDENDVALDLAAFPVIELRQGQHVLLEKAGRLPQCAEDTIRASWKGLLMVHADKEEAGRLVLDKVFRAAFGVRVRKDRVLPPMEDGIQVTLRGDWIFPDGESREGRPRYYCITLTDSQEEGTSPAVIGYLEKQKIRIVDMLIGQKENGLARLLHDGQSRSVTPSVLDGSSAETFVAGFVKALGFLYEPQVPLSFEYAGFQVETTANIIYGGAGLDVVVDFGTFYGEAKAAILAGGMNVLSINPDAGLLPIAESVMNALGTVYSKDPVLHAANRELSKTVSLAFPGYLISYGQGKKVLLPSRNLHGRILEFLHAQHIGAFEVKTML